MSGEPVIVGIYCDGTAGNPHDRQVVANYQRMVGDSGEHAWAPVYSSNDHPGALAPVREWLNIYDQPVQPISPEAPNRQRTADLRPVRAVETFHCELCGFNLPRRWDDVQRVLDTAYGLPRPTILLRELARWIR